MLKIAVCDDETQELSRITGLLKEYQLQRSAVFRFDTFTSAIELLETMRGNVYDILLLDVLMPGFNGIQTAQEIRSFDENIKIIFLTSSPEFAVSSYEVGAYYYLLKPISEAKLFPILDKLYLDEQKVSKTLSLKSVTGITRITYDSIEFLEVINKKLHFHLTDHSIREVPGSLSDYETLLLNQEEFIKVHRSYIVNMGWIKELLPGKIITVSDHDIPISRLLYAQVRESYMQNLFIEKGVL